MKQTTLCKILGIEHPVIQAPMDWITDARLAAAVSNAGGLGVIGPNAGEREGWLDYELREIEEMRGST
jgi:enoyl-[acyl-carrier protein] reductase II